MPKPILLSIEKPCTRTLQKTGNGRSFCDHCSKEVIDFSHYTDKQLIEYFSRAEGPVCGQLDHYQMNRLMHPEQPGKGRLAEFRRVFTAALCLLGAQLKTSQAETRLNENPPVVSFIDKQAEKQAPAETVTREKDKDSLKGRVECWRHRDMVANALVTVENTPLYVFTDSSGHFSMPIPDSLENIAVRITADGYNVASLEIKRSEKGWPVHVYYICPQNMTGGTIVVNPPGTYPPVKDKWYIRVKKWFRKVFRGDYNDTRRLK